MSAPAQSYDYGRRKCLNCGRMFTAEKPSQVTCGYDCRRERARGLHRLHQKKSLLKISELVHDIGILDAVIKEACADFDMVEAAIERLGGLSRHVWKRPEIPDRAPVPAETGEREPPEKKEDDPHPEPEIPAAEKEIPSEKKGEAENPAKEPENASAEKGKAAKAAPPEAERKYCERMKVWAQELPCGMREECFLSPKCSNVPEKFASFGRVCETCGKPLENAKGGRRFCSPSCRMKAAKKRQVKDDDKLWNAGEVEENF